jgi:Alanine dehydrogenase
MKIGVPKEIKPQENRIGLTPESVKNFNSRRP